MDFGRYTYKTKVRMFRDDPTQVELTYYKALPDAPGMPFPTAFVSQRWEKTPWNIDGVGEIYGNPTPYTSAPPIPEAKGLTLCGTRDEFLNGPAFNPNLDIQYGSNKLPLCCGPIAAVGGFSWSGAAQAYTNVTKRGYGGFSWAGTAEASVWKGVGIATGGFSWAGTAEAEVVGGVAVATGGFSWAGTAEVGSPVICGDETLPYSLKLVITGACECFNLTLYSTYGAHSGTTLGWQWDFDGVCGIGPGSRFINLFCLDGVLTLGRDSAPFVCLGIPSALTIVSNPPFVATFTAPIYDTCDCGTGEMTGTISAG